MNREDPNSFRASPGPTRVEAGPSHSALDWARDHGEVERVVRDLEKLVQRRRRRRLALAATSCTLIFSVVAFWSAWRPPTPSVPAMAVPNVLVLNPESRTLPDGSVVVLNAGAELSINFAGPFRRVTLAKGQAHFAVVKDENRPFIVQADGVEVRAVGTAFSVELGLDAVEVLVTEGKVTVDSPAATHTGALPLEAAIFSPTLAPTSPVFEAGKRIVVERTGIAVRPPVVAQLTTVEIAERLAWRVPRLEFADTPLVEALAMFNAYGNVRMRLADPALGRLQLSGVLRANNTESLLQLLEGDFRLVAEQRGNELVLRRR